MNAAAILFYAFASIAAASALGILLVRNVFHGVLLLVVCLLSVAGIYIIAFAEFVAITQLLVYAGGLLVLIIFGVMLTSRISGKPLISQNRLWITGIIPGVLVFGTFAKLFSDSNFAVDSNGRDTSVKDFGTLFMTDYLVQFEFTGLLLLIALVAAAVSVAMAQTKKEA